MSKTIRVWIGVLVIKDWKILYGLRKSEHGNNTYSPPGGHLEFGERIEECAIRELFEESNLAAQESDVTVYSVNNEIYPENEKHYINITTIIQIFSGKLENKEPEKLEEWRWMSWDEIKKLWEKNFLPMQEFIKKYPNFDPEKI